ncbi:hypothetical protein [Mycobacterium sp. C31M]
MGLYGTIGAAIIAAVAPIVYQELTDNGVSTSSHPVPAPTTTAVDPGNSGEEVSFNRLRMDGIGGVTLSGSTEHDINATGVVVSIGPKPAGGYWYGFGDISNSQWDADVRTEPPWQNYEISAAYYYGDLGGAVQAVPAPHVSPDQASPASAQSKKSMSGYASPRELMFHLEPPPTTSPSAPSDELMRCVEQFGPSCFNGPEFGPPSTYQPNQ